MYMMSFITRTLTWAFVANRIENGKRKEWIKERRRKKRNIIIQSQRVWWTANKLILWVHWMVWAMTLDWWCSYQLTIISYDFFSTGNINSMRQFTFSVHWTLVNLKNAVGIITKNANEWSSDCDLHCMTFELFIMFGGFVEMSLNQTKKNPFDFHLSMKTFVSIPYHSLQQ